MVRTIQGSRLPLALVASAVIALAAWAALAGVAHAQSVATTSVNVVPGGSGSFQITAEAPTGGLGAWEVDVSYDTDVIDITGCEAGTGSVCNPDFASDTIRVVGAAATGLSGDIVLATVSFAALGDDGDCSDLSVVVNQFANPEGTEFTASVSSGEVCIETPTPTPSPEPTAEPTEAPTDEATPTASPGGLPDTGGADAGSSSNMAAYLLGLLGLAVVGSGVFAVTRIRNSA